MNNELINIHHEMFGDIRAIERDGELWFVGADIATALGYSNVRDAIARHVDCDDKNTVAFHDGIQGNPNKTIINESGLYSLVLSSKLPSAKKFKHWVTAEVLPSIRRHGAYATAPTIEKIIASPEFGIALLKSLQQEQLMRREAEQQGEEAVAFGRLHRPDPRLPRNGVITVIQGATHEGGSLPGKLM